MRHVLFAIAAFHLLLGGSPCAAQAVPGTTNLPIDPADYGAMCDGATDDRAAYQAAANAAIAAHRPLHLGGRGLCIVNGSINIAGAMTMVGDGPATSVIVQTANAPLFLWDTGGPTVARSTVSGVTLRGQFSGTADYSLSRGIKIIGNATGYFTHNLFANIATEGMYAGFEIARAAVPTSYGMESTAAFNSFDNVSILPGSRPAMFGWLYPNGSGTGNTWLNIKTSMGSATSQVFSFTGAGMVVGDIIVSGHFGGVQGTAIVGVGPGTVYRQNILITGAQADAGVTRPFDLATDTPAFANMHFTGNNVGGGVMLNMPPIGRSIIDDFDSDERRAGNRRELLPAGAFTVPVYSVDFGANAYGGTLCTLIASGLVQGVAGGITTITVLFARSGGAVGTTAVGARTSSVTSSSFFDFGFVASGTGVTINLLGTATSTGSTADTQIRCSGGTYSLRRL